MGERHEGRQGDLGGSGGDRRVPLRGGGREKMELVCGREKFGVVWFTFRYDVWDE